MPKGLFVTTLQLINCLSLHYIPFQSIVFSHIGVGVTLFFVSFDFLRQSQQGQEVQEKDKKAKKDKIKVKNSTME